MSERGFAWLALAAGGALSAAGFFLTRRFRSPEDEGEPRFQPAGPPLRPLVELAGKLLAVFGLCAAGLALMILFA
ncbi:MAG TPA: hypothetical protein DCM05_09875 [Elusimicrobia bacterium]|nr:hypothetical protein [Elusimicrobiota bacterium]